MTEATGYLDTSGGATLVTVSFPDTSTVDDAVLLLPSGGLAGRSRWSHDLRRQIAGSGRPVVSLDYPGSGLSPAERIDNSVIFDLHTEIRDFVVDDLGLRLTGVVGVCKGGRFALRIAAIDPEVREVFAVAAAIAGPYDPGAPGTLIRRMGKLPTRVRNRAARTIRTLRGEDPQPRRPLPGIEKDLRTAARRARLHFLYGEEDVFFSDFQELLSTGVLSETELESVQVHVRSGSLRTRQRVAADHWAEDIILSRLSASVRV